jgi:GH18 family chitinase
MMTHRLILAFVAIPVAWPTSAAFSEQRSAEPFAVVAYLPDYRIDALDPAVGQFLTDLIYFSAQPTADGQLGLGRLSAKALHKLHEMKRLHHTRLLLALGGWQRSRGFAALSANEAARSGLVTRLMQWCLDNHFDGADFDWEHPANATEEASYAGLLAEARRTFQPKKLLVTVALAAWQHLPAEGFRAVNRVHIMAYDHAGPRHATFEQARADVEVFIKRSVDKKKLCLGLPFYGRGIENQNNVLSYAELVRKHQPPASEDELAGVYFNGLRTITRKTRWARETGLGGVMAWELGQDSTDGTSLLRAMHNEAMGGVP